MIRDLVGAGVRGCILKTDAADALVAAVDAVSHHKPFFTPALNPAGLARAIEQMDRGDVVKPMGGELTKREHEVLQLLAEGRTARVAAALLGISIKTVDTSNPHQGEARRAARARTLDHHFAAVRGDDLRDDTQPKPETLQNIRRKLRRRVAGFK